MGMVLTAGDVYTAVRQILGYGTGDVQMNLIRIESARTQLLENLVGSLIATAVSGHEVTTSVGRVGVNDSSRRVTVNVHIDMTSPVIVVSIGEVLSPVGSSRLLPHLGCLGEGRTDRQEVRRLPGRQDRESR